MSKIVRRRYSCLTMSIVGLGLMQLVLVGIEAGIGLIKSEIKTPRNH